MSDFMRRGVCPECEQEIVVDSREDAVICEFCGKPISVKKAIGKFAVLHKKEFAADAKDEVVNKGKSAAENVIGFALGLSNGIKEAKEEKKRKIQEAKAQELER